MLLLPLPQASPGIIANPFAAGVGRKNSLESISSIDRDLSPEELEILQKVGGAEEGVTMEGGPLPPPSPTHTSPVSCLTGLCPSPLSSGGGDGEGGHPVGEGRDGESGETLALVSQPGPPQQHSLHP